MTKRVNWKKIGYWLLTLFIVYILLEVIRKIIGGSLGFEELVIGLLIANMGYSFYLNSKVSEILGYLKAMNK